MKIDSDNNFNNEDTSEINSMHVFNSEDAPSRDSASAKVSRAIDKANVMKVESIEFAKEHSPNVYIKKCKKSMERTKEKTNEFFKKIDNLENKIKTFHNSAPQLTRKNNLLGKGKGDIAKNIIAICLYIGAIFLWMFGHKFICIIIFILTTIFYVFTSYSLK